MLQKFAETLSRYPLRQPPFNVLPLTCSSPPNMLSLRSPLFTHRCCLALYPSSYNNNTSLSLILFNAPAAAATAEDTERCTLHLDTGTTVSQSVNSDDSLLVQSLSMCGIYLVGWLVCSWLSAASWKGWMCNEPHGHFHDQLNRRIKLHLPYN